MQRFFFFSIEINGYWWLKLLDNSFSLVSMLCLLTVTDAESCLSASSHLCLCGLPVHLSLGEWVHEARSTPHSSSHPLVLLTIMNDVSISQSTVKMIAYLQRSKITLNLMMHDTYSPRTWVFFLWNNSCCSVRRCHVPKYDLIVRHECTCRLRVGDVHSHLTGLPLLALEGTVSFSLLDSLPSSLEAGGEWSPCEDRPQMARCLAAWPGSYLTTRKLTLLHEPGPAPGRNTKVQWPAPSSEQVRPPLLSQARRLSCVLQMDIFLLKKKEIKPVA